MVITLRSDSVLLNFETILKASAEESSLEECSTGGLLVNDSSSDDTINYYLKNDDL